jgi:glycerol transport system permease protein
MFSAIILAIQIPLGIADRAVDAEAGFWASACLVLMALPLLIPWNVVGTIWQILGRVDIGLLGYTLDKMGISYNYTQNAVAAWITVVVMDVWHWTSLVACWPMPGCNRSPTPITRPPRSTRPAAGRCFAISSCRRCRACC